MGIEDWEIELLDNVLGELIPRRTANEIKSMDFLTFCAYIGDTNVAPGGWKTIQQLVELVGITPQDHILDIGSNTGHSSFVLYRCSRAAITGIDIRPDLVEVSRRIARQMDIPVTFGVTDARWMPFKDSSFSIVVSTGTLAFITDRRENAVVEMARVTAPWGFVVDTCLHYVKDAPPSVREKASALLESPIPPYTLDDYIRLYSTTGLTCIESQPVVSRNRAGPDTDILPIVKWVLEREMALCEAAGRQATEEALNVIKTRLISTLEVFWENSRYLDCRVLVFRKVE